MTDTRSPADRRRIMAAVRRRDTAPELALRRALFAAGIRGWRCDYGRAPGRPDLAWPVLRVAVFVDGAFWHGHPSRHKPGRSGAYWDMKIAANVERDRRVDDELRNGDWRAVRVWDFEIARTPTDVVQGIHSVLLERCAELSRSPAWLIR
jgi:DNA mismatch endonuclease, patch repair protein